MVRPSKRSSNDNLRSPVRDLVMVVVGAALGGSLAVRFSSESQLMGCPMVLGTAITNNTTTPISTSIASSSSPRSSQPSFIPQGMHPIYSYFGKLNHLADEIPNRWWLETSPQHKDNKQGAWFAQHGQDVAVAKFFNFQKDGFFVDLAANDAVWASNTFSLEQNFGWKGICIEANPIYWYRLSFRNCNVVGGIVGGQNNVEVQVVLGESHHGPYGGIVGDEFDNKNKKKSEKPADKRYTVSLETVLDMFNAPKIIDYLSLDVEGAETFIMKEFPFEKYRFKVMTVERPKDVLKALFEKHGYKHVLDFKRGDTLWAHESVYEQGKKYTDINQNDIHDHKVRSPIPGFS